MSEDSFERRRFTRQLRLPEIGDAGQARLCRAKVRPSGAGFGRVVEERYLRAAGVGLDSSGRVPTSPELPHANANANAHALALGLRHDAPRDVAEGALLALAAIRAVLDAE